MVAAGALVPEGMEVPPDMLVMGDARQSSNAR